MAFVVGELFLPSFTRWCGQITGQVFTEGAVPVAVPGQWRGLILSPYPSTMKVLDVDDGVTVFGLTAFVAPPAGKPPAGTVVKAIQSPNAFQGLLPLTSFPQTLPVPYVAQVGFYVNIGGFGIYAGLYGNDGTIFVALPAELTT